MAEVTEHLGFWKLIYFTRILQRSSGSYLEHAVELKIALFENPLNVIRV